jgi:hypothetical protein
MRGLALTPGPSPASIQGRTEHVGKDAGWGVEKRLFPSPPNPLSHKERGGTGRIRKRPIAF